MPGIRDSSHLLNSPAGLVKECLPQVAQTCGQCSKACVGSVGQEERKEERGIKEVLSRMGGVSSCGQTKLEGVRVGMVVTESVHRRSEMGNSRCRGDPKWE